MQEVFRTIPGFSRYEVSNLGTIKSNTRKKPRIMKLGEGNYYPKVNMRDDNKKRYAIFVHQLVAMAFLGYERPGSYSNTPFESRLVVDHIDNNKYNNCVTNLRIITQRENIARMYTRELPNNVYLSKNKKVYIVRVGGSKSGGVQHRIGLGQYATVEEAVEARDNYLASIGQNYISI